jgi:carboxyl-terminal processing protease
MEEAVELSGIFIDAGPVAQIKTREAKTLTLKDMNRGTIYDGPLILLVNGLSASASEMVAGTLQDYNRALIVGSPTYGKATAQVVLPIDTTINLDTYQGNKEADSYIKLTISKLYRINGTSAQLRGVVPDISLPDPTMASSEREANEKNAIQVPNIDANKYYKPLPALQVAAVQAVAKKEMDSLAYFKAIDQYIQQTKKEKEEKDISLLLDDALQEAKKQNLPQETPATTDTKPEKGPGFAVVNHSYDQRRLKSDEDLKKMDDEWKENLLNDPYVQMAYYLLIPMTK